MFNTALPMKNSISHAKSYTDEVRKEVKLARICGTSVWPSRRGEHPDMNPIRVYTECIDTNYSSKHRNGAIRPCKFNILRHTVENCKKLKYAALHLHPVSGDLA
jgi:2-iminoacetate synthase